MLLLLLPRLVLLLLLLRDRSDQVSAPRPVLLLLLLRLLLLKSLIGLEELLVVVGQVLVGELVRVRVPGLGRGRPRPAGAAAGFLPGRYRRHPGGLLQVELFLLLVSHDGLADGGQATGEHEEGSDAACAVLLGDLEIGDVTGEGEDGHLAQEALLRQLVDLQNERVGEG